MPEDDLGSPLKITCEMVYPGVGFSLKPIPPLPLASTPVTRALSGDLAGVTKQGLVLKFTLSAQWCSGTLAASCAGGTDFKS